jgi:hypothetical protein
MATQAVKKPLLTLPVIKKEPLCYALGTINLPHQEIKKNGNHEVAETWYHLRVCQIKKVLS